VPPGANGRPPSAPGWARRKGATDRLRFAPMTQRRVSQPVASPTRQQAWTAVGQAGQRLTV
jgi:hypothetical protein